MDYLFVSLLRAFLKLQHGKKKHSLWKVKEKHLNTVVKLEKQGVETKAECVERRPRTACYARASDYAN